MITKEIHPDFILSQKLRKKYLYVLVTGPKIDFDISNKLWNRIYSKVVELGINKVLVEEDFPNQLNTIEIFQTSEIIAKMFKGNVKIALVDQHQSNLNLNKFEETVAVNRGLLMKAFDNITDGEKWLID